MAEEKKLTGKEKQKIAPRVEEGMNRNAFLKPREATKTTKQAFKGAKKNYKLAKEKHLIEQKKHPNSIKNGTSNKGIKRNYNLVKQNHINGQMKYKNSIKNKSINPMLAKKKYLDARVDKKVAKKVFQKTKAVDGTRITVQAKIGTKQKGTREIKQHLTSALNGDDTLREGLDQYRKGQQINRNIRTGFRTSKNIGRLAIKSGKDAYGAGNRLFNFSRGRGFNRTPNDMTNRKQLMKRIRNYKQRLKVAKEVRKAERGLSLIRSVFSGEKTVLQGVKLLLKSPITWVVMGVIIMIILLAGVVSGSAKPAIVQEDEDLTDSWVYMTKLDAENSDESNVFFSNIDDVMFHMNYRFDDYALAEYVYAPQTYEMYLTDVWTDLNGKPPEYELKKMGDLETKKGSKYAISEDDYEDYLEVKNEVGYSSLDGQLDYPYETESLVITRRYGYEKKEAALSLHAKIETPTEGGQEIKSPMEGVVSVLSETSIQVVEEKEARLTIEGVQSSRFKNGDMVTESLFLGNATGDHLTIQYEKYQEEQDKWISVNPGFYFPKVTYTQTTELGISNFDPNADVATRAKAVYDHLTKLGYTKAGISAILGNFSVESGINPKRAEGDYLSPPVGASGNSWDDPSWLALGGLAIYGKYPNILHRGLGLGQWTDTADGSRRHTMLLDYAKSKNKKWYDLELQLDFIFNGDSPGARTAAANTAGSKVGTTVPELTVYFLNYWEGNPGDKVSERIQAAQNWYAYFSESSTNLSASSKEVFEKYKDKMSPLPTDKEMKQGQGWAGNSYALGNCTWYVYNRMKQLGKSIHPTMGNAKQWVNNYTQTPGATLVPNPQRGDVAIFTNGVAGYPALYGHVGVVEYVNSDGTFVISEMNISGEYSMGWRVLKKETGMYFMRVN